MAKEYEVTLECGHKAVCVHAYTGLPFSQLEMVCWRPGCLRFRRIESWVRLS